MIDGIIFWLIVIIGVLNALSLWEDYKWHKRRKALRK